MEECQTKDTGSTKRPKLNNRTLLIYLQTKSYKQGSKKLLGPTHNRKPGYAGRTYSEFERAMELCCE